MAKLLLGSVVGPQGPQGTPGVNGSQGPQGIPGPNEIAATTDVVGLTTGQLLYNNGGKVGSVDIVDNLLSIDPDKPLSANQGKILKGLIDDNDSAIGQINSDLDVYKAETDQQTSGFVNIEQFPIITPEIDDTGRLKRAIQYALDNKVALNLSGKTYNISEEIKIIGRLELYGNIDTVLNFTHTSGYAITLESAKVVFDTFTIKGTKSISGLNFNPTEDINKPIVDSRFSGIRLDTFSIAINTAYSWDNYFNSCRIHNVTKIGNFGNQSNLMNFQNCRFSTYNQGFSFSNCEALLFNECDIVGYATTPANEVVSSVFQSQVSFRNCYVEHVNKFGSIGASAETVGSSVNIEGGRITGVVKNLILELRSKIPATLNVKNVVCDSVSLTRASNAYYISLLDNKSSIDNKVFSLLSKYDGDVDITTKYSKKFGGDALTTELHTGFARLKPAAWNGVNLSTNLTIGKTYTLVICYKSNNGTFGIVNGVEGTNLPQTTNFTQVTSPFVASDTKLILVETVGVEGKSVDIAYIRLYEGLNVKDFSRLMDERVIAEIV